VLRRPTILAALAATLVLTTRPTPAGAQASSSSTSSSGSSSSYYAQGYTLTVPAAGIPVGDPNATSPEFVFQNTPAGAIVAPPDGSNPMTFLPNSIGYTPPGSTATSPYVIIDLLKKDGSQFGLSFFNTPLVQGNVFHVDLDINTALQSNPPTFVSNPPPAGSNLPIVSLVPDPPPATSTPPPSASGGSTQTTTTTTTTTTETPEPLSLVLWSVLAGIGFWSARRRRSLWGA
jgi:hypothetical protein